MTTNENSSSKRGPVRMQEIADALAISVSTVSRALKGDPVVNEETRLRVSAEAVKLGYRINHTARSLRTQRTGLVLVVVPDIGNPFYSYVLAGIEEEAQSRGYAVLIGNLAGRPELLASYAEQVLSGRVDGVILLTGSIAPIDWLNELLSPAPVVALCERLTPDIPFVGIDDIAAARLVVEHLISLGRRCIGYINGPDWSSVAAGRRAGYRAALMGSGLGMPDFLEEQGDTTIDGGYDAAVALLAKNPSLDAIFCANDEMAIGAVNALRTQGIAIPDQVAVAGCDGLEFGAKFYPPITTVEQPRLDLGRHAMATLAKVLDGDRYQLETLLPVSLILRETA